MIEHKPFAVIFTVGLALVTSGAQPAAAAELNPAARYHQCLALAETLPKEAFEDAIAWRDEAGGPPAEHCAATALINLGLYQDAAKRLEDLAQRMKGRPGFKARIFGQAAQAWLLADNPNRAEAVATAALQLQPGDIEFYIDRAQARAALGDYPKAVSDLDAALAINAGRPDALALRAAAKRFLKDMAGALADAEQALMVSPGHAEALLERGNLRRLKDDKAGARADWLEVLIVAPDSPAATAARANLERMDVRK